MIIFFHILSKCLRKQNEHLGFFQKTVIWKFPSKDSFYYISEHSELWKRERLPTKFQPSFSWPLLFSAAGTDFYRLVQHTVETPSKVLPEPRAWCNQPAQQGQSPGMPSARGTAALVQVPHSLSWGKAAQGTFGDGTPTANSSDETSLLLDQCCYHQPDTTFSTERLFIFP